MEQLKKPSLKLDKKTLLSKARAAEYAFLLTTAASIGVLPSLKAEAQSADIPAGSCVVLMPNADPNKPPVSIIQPGGCAENTNTNQPAALPAPAAVPQTVNEPAPAPAAASNNSVNNFSSVRTSTGGNNEEGFNPLYGVGIALLLGVTAVKWLGSRK